MSPVERIRHLRILSLLCPAGSGTGRGLFCCGRLMVREMFFRMSILILLMILRLILFLQSLFSVLL